jgi:hypothetical protein
MKKEKQRKKDAKAKNERFHDFTREEQRFALARNFKIT